jgi:hypothetical protein
LHNLDDPEFIAMVERGLPLKKLEERLRPNARLGGNQGPYSEVGFLGANESLLELIHSDLELVKKYGITPSEIADAINELIAGRYLPNAAKRELHPAYEFLNTLQKFAMTELGDQDCPWGCLAENGFKREYGLDLQESGAICGAKQGIILKKGISAEQRKEAVAIDLVTSLGDNPSMAGRISGILTARYKGEIFYAPITTLLPHLIRCHNFFEGKESPYRADPAFLIEALNLRK